MRVEVEFDWPKGVDLASLGDWRLKLGPKLAEVFKQMGLPTGMVLFIEIRDDE